MTLLWCLQVTEFDISHREFTSWSQQFTEHLPVAWSCRNNKIRQLFYHPRQWEKIFICDDEAFCIIDKLQVSNNVSGIWTRTFLCLWWLISRRGIWWSTCTISASVVCDGQCSRGIMCCCRFVSLYSDFFMWKLVPSSAKSFSFVTPSIIVIVVYYLHACCEQVLLCGICLFAQNLENYWSEIDVTW